MRLLAGHVDRDNELAIVHAKAELLEAVFRPVPSHPTHHTVMKSLCRHTSAVNSCSSTMIIIAQERNFCILVSLLIFVL